MDELGRNEITIFFDAEFFFVKKIGDARIEDNAAVLENIIFFLGLSYDISKDLIGFGIKELYTKL